MTQEIEEYVGLTREARSLVEHFRSSANESKSDILVRVLSPLKQPVNAQPTAQSDGFLDLGQGARLRVGERPVLYLSEETKRRGRPDAVAEIRRDSEGVGFFLEGKKIKPPKGNPLQPAMKLVQERKEHRNAQGKLISLSAWRQWHVIRNGKLLSMVELKDPALAHKRGRDVLTLEDLGL